MRQLLPLVLSTALLIVCACAGPNDNPDTTQSAFESEHVTGNFLGLYVDEESPGTIELLSDVVTFDVWVGAHHTASHASWTGVLVRDRGHAHNLRRWAVSSKVVHRHCAIQPVLHELCGALLGTGLGWDGCNGRSCGAKDIHIHRGHTHTPYR